ncbi:Endonuclease/exonuclease/phosphatase [Xylariaceae sp. FL1272]|nr:Endonuclease/exonuclease/phosphatase [Xylariaceae sp. FL1272]
METPSKNGPDGSSLKPVSSLRMQFESMNKIKEEPSAAPVPMPTISRQRTPSPKPPAVPDTRPARPKSILLPDEIKAKPPVPAPRDPATLRPPLAAKPPPLSPKPLGVKPPAVLVEPPTSPPKDRAIPSLALDTPSLLNPDPIKAPATPVTPSTRPFKIPSRPTTPNLQPRKTSPRLTPSQPPSPPPPRRSVELRLEREAKARSTPPAPPPVNRIEKPTTRPSTIADGVPRLEPRPIQSQTTEKSPFNSPPSLASSPPEDESPPLLPTRPARPMSHNPVSARTNTVPPQFDPPPIHHAVASVKRNQEGNGVSKPLSAPPVPSDRPPLPTRPTITHEAAPKIPASSTMMPPPRRAPSAAHMIVDTSVVNTTQPKRISSTPTSQFGPPPSRTTHPRSMTVDRTSERTPVEFREPPQRFPPTAEKTVIASDPSTTSSSGTAGSTTVFPDATKVNRRPPFAKLGVQEMSMKYDTRCFDVCGEFLVTGGHLARVWNLNDGELLMSLALGDGIKASSVAFKPGSNVNDEGSRIWIGNNMGEVMEADVATQSIVGNKTNLHGRNEVINIFRFFTELWTLDDVGTLHVWGPDNDGLPSLKGSPHQTYRLPRGHTFSMIVGEELWYASGKEIRIFAPTVDGRTQVQVLMRPLTTDGAGDITSGTTLKRQTDKVFFGHTDGKVSVYSRKDYTCLEVISVSTYKINSLAGVGKLMWVAYNTGRISIYDTTQNPWAMKKDWQAHYDGPALKLMADRASFYKLGRQQLLSLGADNKIRIWDSLLEDDYLENEMKSLDSKYCEFQDIKLLAMTWNAGASTPNSLRYSQDDAVFIQNLLTANSAPDILVFGFQELVDLEDKTATAKRLFKSKKKDATDQERMSHQYRDWRDFLVRALDDNVPDHLYHLLQTSTLVGLFTCIFVKSTLRDRVRNLSTAAIKRGMGGLHGNKGAIIVRFMVDDTSLCFVNCHLAAGQTQANSRHNDIASIMDATVLPVERDPTVRVDSFIGGGDGSMVMDHELCLLNGDLNYRIDTMSRDTVVMAVKQNNLQKLLERDQLLVARRRNPAFKLRAFEEMPIQFAPTYKYDVGTDDYDSSEKKRSPAWCDRLLHRGSGRIQQLDYRRHEVRVSDHRPVTGRFKFTIKTISPKKRTLAWADCQQRFEDLKVKEADEEKLSYLMNVIGYDVTISKGLIRDQAARRADRSPVRG